MEQFARNLTDCEEGFLTGRRFLVIDRYAIFSTRFKSILRSSGVEILLTAYKAPNINVYTERFVRSIKSVCLDQTIFLERESLDRAIAEYAGHYHDERGHQGLGNGIVSGAVPQSEGSIEVRERLGGLLKYYCRRAGQPDRAFGHYGLRECGT